MVACNGKIGYASVALGFQPSGLYPVQYRKIPCRAVSVRTLYVDTVAGVANVLVPQRIEKCLVRAVVDAWNFDGAAIGDRVLVEVAPVFRGAVVHTPLIGSVNGV